MIKSLVVFIIVLAALTVSAKEEVKKTDLAVMKKIQYYKVVATEEINVLEKFIKCLDGAKNREMMDLCSKARIQHMSKLRKTAAPKDNSQNLKRTINKKAAE